MDIEGRLVSVRVLTFYPKELDGQHKRIKGFLELALHVTFVNVRKIKAKEPVHSRRKLACVTLHDADVDSESLETLASTLTRATGVEFMVFANGHKRLVVDDDYVANLGEITSDFLRKKTPDLSDTTNSA